MASTTILTPAVGRWAFIIGLFIAVLVGLAVDAPGAGPILFILGLLVGLLNVPERESTGFLVALLVLIAIAQAGLQVAALEELGSIVENVLRSFTSFVTAAGLVVAIKQALTYAKD